ncbi:8656_t:CDS:2, partial [Diversispora eburnea]
NNRGVLWEQELYEGFLYYKERNFFHTFEIDNYLAAFSFANENEADVFHSKVKKNLDSGYDAQNIDPAWKSFLDSLGDLGVPQSIIEKDSNFIMEFVQNNPDVKRLIPTQTSSRSTNNNNSKKLLPAPPPSKHQKRQPQLP